MTPGDPPCVESTHSTSLKEKKDTNNGSSSPKKNTNNGSSSRDCLDNPMERVSMYYIKIASASQNNKSIRNNNNNNYIKKNNNNENNNITNKKNKPRKKSLIRCQLIDLYKTSLTSAFFLAPIQVFFWWDVWYLVDYTFTPDNLTTLNPILSFTLLLTTIVLPQKKWRQLFLKLQKKCSSIHVVVKYIFNMAASVLVVSQWVGVWGALDRMLGVVIYEERVLGPGLVEWEDNKKEQHLWLHLVTSLLACVFFRMSSNMVSPVERAEPDLEDYFTSPTRFQTGVSFSLNFIYDCCFSYVILATLQIHFWRSLWYIYDYYIIPENLISSRCLCVGVVMMVVLAKVLIKTEGVLKNHGVMKEDIFGWKEEMGVVKEEKTDGLKDRRMDDFVELGLRNMEENEWKESGVYHVNAMGLKNEGMDGWKQLNEKKMDELERLILDGGGLERLVGGGLLHFKTCHHRHKFSFKRWLYDVWAALHNSLTTILLWWSLWGLFDIFARQFLTFHFSILVRILLAVLSYTFLYLCGFSQFLSRATFSLDGSENDIAEKNDVLDQSGYS